MIENLKESKNFIESKVKIKPEYGLILGSGLGHVAEILTEKTIIPYAKIPHFPVSTVHGHAGQLVFGRLNSKSVVVMQGRVHYYEGHPLSAVTYPIRLFKNLGVSKLILTSAVGGINKKYKPADIVFVKDHINLMGDNPLIGGHIAEFGERFPDMSCVYSPRLIKLAVNIAKKFKIKTHNGIYLAASGPSYETPSEIRAYRKLGGDVVGMSVVPETIVANQLKIEILCISYISNMASGISKTVLSHEEVMGVGKIAGKKVSKIIKNLIEKI